MSDMLNEALQAVEKAMDTANSGVLSREDLSAIVTKMIPQDTPLRNRLKRVQGFGLAHSWNQLVSLGTLGGAFPEGGLPNNTDSVFDRKAAPYKQIGNVVEITDLMIAAGANFQDTLAFERNNKILKTMLDEERMIINGDSTLMEFDGLLKQVVSNVIDKVSTPGFGIVDLNLAMEEAYIKGGTPRVVVLGPREKRRINDDLLGLVRFAAPRDNVQTRAGISVLTLESDYGEVELVTSRYLTPIPDGNGKNLSSVLVLDDQAVVDNGNSIEMVELVPMSRKPLGATTSSVKELIWEAVTLVVRAEIFQSKIVNIH